MTTGQGKSEYVQEKVTETDERVKITTTWVNVIKVK